MNYYMHHLGDYTRDTAHLTMLEDGAYRRLLDRYYATEAPIPADQAHRIARARSVEEREAVDAVLSEFFTLSDGAWHNSRAEAEIQGARVRIEAAKLNGRKGGRPTKPSRNPAQTQQEPSANPGLTQEKPSGLLLGSENKTQQEPRPNPDLTQQKALHAPCSMLQEESLKESGASAPTTSSKPKRSTGPSVEDLGSLQLPDGLTRDTWQAWVRFRQSLPAAKRIRSIEQAEAQLRQLAGWHADGHDLGKIIAASLAAGWQGLFPKPETLRQHANGSARQPEPQRPRPAPFRDYGRPA